jgi:hypothetical protein
MNLTWGKTLLIEENFLTTGGGGRIIIIIILTIEEVCRKKVISCTVFPCTMGPSFIDLSIDYCSLLSTRLCSKLTA